MVPAAKLTYCFVLVFAVLAAGSFATPAPVNGHHPISSRQSAGELDKPSGTSIVGNAEWIFEHLAAVVGNTFNQKFVNVVASWLLDTGARLEFLAMADGSHAIFPQCGGPEKEREHRVIAVAVSNLLRNLRTMERTDEVVRNVTKTVLREAPHNYVTADESDSSLEKKMSAFLRSYFETMNRLFDEDTDLAVEYRKQKAEAEKYVAKHDGSIKPASAKVWEGERLGLSGKEKLKTFLRDKEILRQVYVNKIFMKQAVKNAAMIFEKKYLEHYTLARALIKKAHESSDFESRVNQVYHKALSRVGGMTYVDVEDSVISDTLFDEIQKGLVEFNNLHEEIQESMKQIEKTTMYDTDMFHVDLSFL